MVPNQKYILSILNDKFGTTRRDKVGTVTEWIHRSKPTSIEEWKIAYIKLSNLMMRKNDARRED